MVNVVIARKNPVVVTQQDSNILSTKSVTVRNTTDLSNAPRRLDQLADVVELNPQDNFTLVYESSSDKYIVKALDLDGGEF
jgi:hypothetical protein